MSDLLSGLARYGYPEHYVLVDDVRQALLAELDRLAAEEHTGPSDADRGFSLGWNYALAEVRRGVTGGAREYMPLQAHRHETALRNIEQASQTGSIEQVGRLEQIEGALGRIESALPHVYARLRGVEDELARREVNDGEMFARLGTDAVKWAEDFVGSVSSHGILALEDHEIEQVASWFANAIEAGRSAGKEARR